MTVIIQCAASKRSDAGHLITCSGKPVEFVGSPNMAPHRSDRVYARPDDFREDGMPWRKVLQTYNENPGDNPLRLCRAFELYKNETYRRLVERFNIESVYILSAGWGLIRSDFLTPHYDITFRSGVDAYKRRCKKDHYEDYRMLPRETRNDVVFFGARAYLSLFCSLTDAIHSRKIVFFNSKSEPPVGGCEMRRFQNATRSTNWQYDCANAFIDGTIRV
jgi:hypothetical protein